MLIAPLITSGSESDEPRVRALATRANSGVLRRSGRKIEPRAGRTVLNLDNPEVRIEGDFPFEPLLRLAGIDAVSIMRPNENPLHALPELGGHRLRRRPVERRVAVEVIDFHENGAGLCGAAAAKDRARPFHSASTQIGGDPNVRAQAQPVQRPPARAARVSCLRSRGVISVEGGKPWTRSKSRRACWVARPSFPSGLTG
jgi:hypothetical protein